MYSAHKTGKEGEDKAVEFLLQNQFVILDTNFRYKRAEIDIVAQKENVLHLVEVKTRKNNVHGFPEEFVSDRKIELFHEAAEELLESLQWNGEIQFDIIAITLKPNEIEYIPEAF